MEDYNDGKISTKHKILLYPFFALIKSIGEKKGGGNGSLLRFGIQTDPGKNSRKKQRRQPLAIEL